MKKLIIIFIFIVLVVFTTGTSVAQTQLYWSKVKKDAVPSDIIEALPKDFQDATASEYAILPLKIIDGRMYVYSEEVATDEDFDTYLVTLTGKSGVIRATYDKDGHVMSAVKSLKNVPLPHNIQLAIAKNFPGWGITGNKMKLISYKNGKEITRYQVKLQNGKKHHSVIVDADGNVIHGKK